MAIHYKVFQTLILSQKSYITNTKRKKELLVCCDLMSRSTKSQQDTIMLCTWVTLRFNFLVFYSVKLLHYK